MKIVKRSGEFVEFDRGKLEASLKKSGASDVVIQDIVHQIERQLYDGASTKFIYEEAFRLLKKNASSHAARYNLRTGILQLGPAGFFFEKFIARIFEKEGFQTKSNEILW